MTDKIVIYTDGACRGNPGPGGWGAIIIENNIETELYGKKKKYYKQYNGNDCCN